MLALIFWECSIIFCRGQTKALLRGRVMIGNILYCDCPDWDGFEARGSNLKFCPYCGEPLKERMETLNVCLELENKKTVKVTLVQLAELIQRAVIENSKRKDSNCQVLALSDYER